MVEAVAQAEAPVEAPMTEEQAAVLRLAEAEGLELLRADNKTGFRGVSMQKNGTKRFKAEVSLNGKVTYLGSFATAEEAALAIARALAPKAEEAPAEAAVEAPVEAPVEEAPVEAPAEPEAEEAAAPAVTEEQAAAAAEALRLAAAEGLELERVERTDTSPASFSGFKGVEFDGRQRTSKPYVVRRPYLGTFRTAEEAALARARAIGGGAAEASASDSHDSGETLSGLQKGDRVSVEFGVPWYERAEMVRRRRERLGGGARRRLHQHQVL